MKDAALKHYHARMRRVLIYIDEHLGDDLNLDVLSDVAAFSKFHFHRQFSELFGLNVSHYVQLLRLKRASYQLAFRDDCPVLEVAFDSGYEGPEAFARAFKQHVGQSPSAFRKQPHWSPWQSALAPVKTIRSTMMNTQFEHDQVRIVDFPATSVAILEHRGDPALIGDSIQRFVAWRKQHGLPPKSNATYTILHHDPETTPPESYRTDLCVATERKVEPNDSGIIAGLIPAGRCATFRYIGSNDALKQAVMHLYGDWLPASGEELRDFPAFVHRVNMFPDVAEHEAVTDIYLPLK